ncbi:L-ascorbate peroxidase [Handroanthus impetiginosus]|uniref:L-ascorbate peroxidase n=1 Tax=Handroanthus impetiginosus TaxID=429701 RepID=A0A2G9GY58_9LAMI|nr:L-ascorbate peroxidase [Handroanthus impetiginosus]
MEKNKFNECYLFELQKELSETMKQKIRAEYEAIGGSPDKPLRSNYFLNIMIVIAVLAFVTSLVMN